MADEKQEGGPAQADATQSGPEYQAVEPLSPDHLKGWKSTTSGLEDYAMWRQTLKGQRLEGDPPFRRGRIWA
jgi:cyanobactin cluster PatC/TenC/TruC protein